MRDWLGPSFALGPHQYASDVLTIRDLLTHRTGLAEGQGDLLGSLVNTSEYVRRLRLIEPEHSLRSTFDYSNTGWAVAGEVLRSAAGAATSWCSALHATLLRPLGLNSTFCHRNEVPAPIAAAHLAAVHKANPCARRDVSERQHHSSPIAQMAVAEAAGNPPLATYDFVPTGGPNDYAWGAADAAGSVISCAADMAVILGLLLGTRSSKLLHPRVIDEMLTGQMTVPNAWMQTCGVPGWNREAGTSGGGAGGNGGGGEASSSGIFHPFEHTAGKSAAAGLGFDLVSDLFVGGRRRPYAEKNGDTNMHKARLGMLPADGSAVLLLSNLGGSMGGPLTALKFGALAILGGERADGAERAAATALNTTRFWTAQWDPETTCTACNRSGASGPCAPSGFSAPPLPASSFVGTFGRGSYAKQLTLAASTGTPGSGSDGSGAGDGSVGLTLSFGPMHLSPLRFSNLSLVLHATRCAEVSKALTRLAAVAPWGRASLERLAALPGNCSLTERVVPAEIQAVGVSASEGRVAFPWGCGLVPLPDGPSLYAVSHAGRGVLVAFLGEVMEVSN